MQKENCGSQCNNFVCNLFTFIIYTYMYIYIYNIPIIVCEINEVYEKAYARSVLCCEMAQQIIIIINCFFF